MRKLIRKIQVGIMKRQSKAQLHGMTDRELKDIGICRGDINRVIDIEAAEWLER